MSERPDLHPVIEIARGVIRRDDQGVFHLDAKGAHLLEHAILAHADDVGLPDALRTLFGLLAIMSDGPGSPAAAAMLVAVLGRVQPHLTQIAPDAGRLADHQSERLKSTARAVFGDRVSNADKMSGPRPKGAISVRDLDIPPLPRPGVRRPARRG